MICKKCGAKDIEKDTASQKLAIYREVECACCGHIEHIVDKEYIEDMFFAMRREEIAKILEDDFEE